VALFLEQRGRLAEGVVCRVGLAGQRKALGQRPERVPLLVGVLVAHRLERRTCPPDRLFAVAELSRAPRLVRVEPREVDGLWVRTEELLGDIEVAAGFLGTALRHQDVAAEQVGASEVQRVVRHGKQCDRAPYVVERGGRAALEVVQAGEAPVETHPRVRIRERICLLECSVENRLRTVEVAHVGQGKAEVRREADLRRDVLWRVLFDFREAALEHFDRLVGT
jgi:hypothetical protein